MAETRNSDAAVTTNTDEPAIHDPYVPDEADIPEFTWPAVLIGAVLGIIFGASSLYLVLKVGLTVSASIPVAVLSITLFRVFSRFLPIRKATILENNIVQTTGSAGESIAFGVGVTMPALLLLGFEMDVVRVMTVATLGGLLGILMMIPLRRAFIVKQHGTLKYPEGTACADVLIVGEKGGATAKTVFVGFGLAFLFTFLMKAMKLWKDTLDKNLYTVEGRGLKKGVLGSELGPELLGVGYIIGPRIASIMVAGGVLAYLVMIPTIAYVGDGLEKALPPAKEGLLIRDMSVGQLRSNYILYIGAGAVATGGIISMLQALPVIFSSVLSGFRDLTGRRGSDGSGPKTTPRTERDLPMSIVVLGSLGLVGAIAAAPKLGLGFNTLGLVAAGLIVLLGFLFVTVSSRLTGEIGSSSNPISGMTVAALLLTCLVFLLIHKTDKPATLTALTVAAIVCIASSNGGTTSQDLKTGYLVGGTPKWQQLSILVGALTSAVVIGFTLLMLNTAGTIYTKKKENLPKLEKLEPEQLAKLMERSVEVTQSANAPGGEYDGDPVDYIVLHVGESEKTESLPPGKFLVDDEGKIHYKVDPAINGELEKTDSGVSKKGSKFTAPKAQLMAKIIDGILNRKLPWGLVLLGVLIAVTLELSGVPSLPFAVGVYLPLQSSVPIFIGGMVRLLVTKLTAKPRVIGQPPPKETDEEMSSGSLLATGYIAGGTIAGVVFAFLSMSDSLTKPLQFLENRRITLPRERSVEDAYTAIAFSETEGMSENDPRIDAFLKEQSNRDEQARINARRDRGIADKYDETEDINKEEILAYTPISAGTKIKLPDGTYFTAPKATTLGDIARDTLKNPAKVTTLFEDNKDDQALRSPQFLPEGAVLKIPQGDLLAVVTSSLMVLFLFVVGMGFVLKTPPPVQVGS